MADTYEKDLGAKSAITNSDYIRVVGSDNVSYKQPMSFFPTKAEVNALPTKSSFSIRSVTWAYTIDANSNTNTNLYTLINNDLPSGSTCLGVVGFSTNTVNVVPIAMQYYNSNYSAQLRNISDSSVSNNLNVRYLCLA